MRTHSPLAAAFLIILALAVATGARAQNLIPDPAFTLGVSAWMPNAVIGDFTMSFAPNFSKRPGSGSALLSATGSTSGSFAVCLPVSEGASYDWGYSIFFPDAARVPGFFDFVQIYAGPGCSGANLGGRTLTILPGSVNTWVGQTNRLVMPPGSNSISLGFGALGVGRAEPLAYLDDVFFGLAGTVPPIDVPVAVPSLSRSSAAALGLILAVAALRSLRS